MAAGSASVGIPERVATAKGQRGHGAHLQAGPWLVGGVQRDRPPGGPAGAGERADGQGSRGRRARRRWLTIQASIRTPDARNAATAAASGSRGGVRSPESVVVGGGVTREPPGAVGTATAGGAGVAPGPGTAGAGVGGARANGGSSPTIALGWMLRSWFLLPEPSSCSVRMCHGAPDTSPAPSRSPPFALSQYADWARWPPPAMRDR